MTVLRRRSRNVSFRLSPEEYEAMKERCITEGVRSISEFARTSACRVSDRAEVPRKDLETEMKIQMLREWVSDLDREVRRLSQILDAARLLRQVVDGVKSNQNPASVSDEKIG
jgi:hypothetical protein